MIRLAFVKYIFLQPYTFSKLLIIFRDQTKKLKIDSYFGMFMTLFLIFLYVQLHPVPGLQVIFFSNIHLSNVKAILPSHHRGFLYATEASVVRGWLYYHKPGVFFKRGIRTHVETPKVHI